MKFIIKEGANPNYLATICRIGETFPIEGADKIQRVVINGYDMVVSKAMKEGDTVVYFPVETAISPEFLSANNLYEISEYERNSNTVEVGNILEETRKLKEEGRLTDAEAKLAEAKAMVGFFNKRGRVRILKLKGIYSSGFIASPSMLINAYPDLVDINWDTLIGTQFNMIGDKELCWKYVPPVKEIPVKDSQRRFKKRIKKIKKFDRIIEDTFIPHYDTKKINDNMFAMSPNDIVTMSVKVHGTSIILANIPVKRQLTTWEKVKKFFGVKVPETEYDNIYSSRSVIKNQYINSNAQNFYSVDIWGCVNRDFAKFIPRNTTVYGEVVGYLEGSQTMIQKDHDYGCKVGEWKFMPYRISTTMGKDKRFEWNVKEVLDWTLNLIKDNPEIADKVLPLQIVYHGKFKDLYPDINTEQHWHENVLARMKEDTEHFGMELKEPMCHLYEAEANAAKTILDKAIANGESKKNIKKLQAEWEKWEAKRAPREGIVIRIDNDPHVEAWKLKTNAHYNREAVQHDNGEVDIEEIA